MIVYLSVWKKPTYLIKLLSDIMQTETMQKLAHTPAFWFGLQSPSRPF